MNNYNHYLYQNEEFGITVEVRHPIIVVKGLPNAEIDEIVVFEEGQRGMVFSMSRDVIEVLLFSQEQIRNGASVARTGESINVRVGNNLLGKTIGAMGDDLYEEAATGTQDENVEYKPINTEAPNMDKRTKITKPFVTGTSVVDLMIPLGKGQRELVIGDRKTGKTSFLLTSIISQAKEDTVIIYGAIGRRQSEIKKIEEFLRQQNVLQQSVIVASSSNDSSGYIYITPYTAMTLAEFFRDQGRDVLIILDDLTYHAKIYREISLLANRFPGRDAYPGDIFYLHSKLLERAGAFIHPEKKEVFITCFPVAESIDGDLRGYITTNLMGMTDGHIFFDSDIYFQGIRPAVNIQLSVTRVGRQTQSKLRKEINTLLLSFLSNYNKLQTLSHFGSELSGETEITLKRGERLQQLFNQHYKTVTSSSIQLVMLGLIWSDILSDEPVSCIRKLSSTLTISYDKDKKFYDDMANCDSLEVLVNNVKKYKDDFLKICRTQT